MKKIEGRPRAGKATIAKLKAAQEKLAGVTIEDVPDFVPVSGWWSDKDHWAEIAKKDAVISRLKNQQDVLQESHIDTLLAERGARYGNFADHARITQSIKFVMHTTEKWQHLADDQMEALQMIAHKIGRILNGDPDYADSWVDIAGYAKLVADRLEKEQK